MSSSIIVGPGEMGVVIVDVSTNFNVTVTTEYYREEGSPDSAMQFAERIRTEHGDVAEELALAIENAAQYALDRRKKEQPQPS